MHTFHTSCPTIRFRPAFLDLVEGAELFRRIALAIGPLLLALCVMPDHVHLVSQGPVQRQLRGALSGYTRWRNHRHRQSGPLFGRVPEPHRRTGGAKILRDQRYTELNPCRAGLVIDPLAWPLSTWRDRMGLAWPPVRDPARDVARWHAYATKDDYVQAAALPYMVGDRDPHDVVAAVSSVSRLPTAALRRRGPARTLLVASLRSLTPISAHEIAALTGMTANGVRRIQPREVPGHTVIERVAGDPRFQSLDATRLDLRSYRRRQLRNAEGPGAGWT